MTVRVPSLIGDRSQFSRHSTVDRKALRFAWASPFGRILLRGSPFLFGNLPQTSRLSKESRTRNSASNNQQEITTAMSIFDEKYRVVGVENDRLLVRGVHSGEVLTIVNPELATPLSKEEYPVGKLIALTDPSTIIPRN